MLISIETHRTCNFPGGYRTPIPPHPTPLDLRMFCMLFCRKKNHKVILLLSSISCLSLKILAIIVFEISGLQNLISTILKGHNATKGDISDKNMGTILQLLEKKIQ